MRQVINELVDPKLPALEKLERLRDAPVDWDDPDWAQQWVEEGRREGHKEGLEEAREEGRAEVRTEILAVIREEVRGEAEEKFGPETAARLAGDLGRVSDLNQLMEIAMEIYKGASYATLLKRFPDGHSNGS